MKTSKFFYSIFLLYLHYAVCFDYSQLHEEIETCIHNNKISSALRSNLNDFLKSENNPEKDETICNICRIVTNATISLQRSGGTKKEINKFASDMCNLFLPSVIVECNRYIDNLINAWMYIIDNKPDITPEYVCRIRLQDKNCFRETETYWQVNLPEGRSKELPTANNEIQNKIMHISDVHYDPLYKVGSAAVCKDVLCCETISGEPKSREDAAGYWGDYHICDMPWNSVEDLMEQVTQHNVSWVYFTGDMISHQIGVTSPNGNTDIIRKLMQKLKDTFIDIPVYFILGNHEPHPADAFSPESITAKDLSTQWLFDLMAEEWGRWLSDDPKATIRKGGFYTTLLKPGLRLIALNSNVCFTNNIWLLYNDSDTYGQLQWLSDTLLAAEKNQEAVHILTHIPAGEPTCLRQWNNEYSRIIQRFHKTITAQFNGHTHFEGFKLFYDSNTNDEVINVAFNGGSFTTFIGNNPNFKIYHTQGKYHQVENYEIWTYDLSEANRNNTQPKWYQLYSFKEAFGIESLNEKSYDILVKKLATDRNMLEKYRRFGSRNGTANLRECDLNCWRHVFCDITHVKYEESVQCKWFKKHKFL